MTGFTSPAEITRDRWGRPLIVPPDGGKAKAYTRATTLAGTPDDTYALGKWLQRQEAIGFVDRPDLLLAAASSRDDKRRLDQICEQAVEASKASAAATVGTAVHSLTEVIDRGDELPAIPDAYLADLDAYRTVTAPLTPVLIEQMVVLDDIEVAGTPDRVVEFDGRRYIADVKTGKIDYGAQKIAIQLALYSRGVAYDIGTGERTPIEGVDQDRAIVIHLPAGAGECSLHWIDIAAGWEAVQLAVEVRAWRKRRGLLSPVEVSDSLVDRIASASSVGDLEALFRVAGSEWGDEHTAAAAARKAELSAAA